MNFKMENGMLTASMKLRRRVVAERYRQQIEEMYEQAETAGPVARLNRASVEVFSPASSCLSTRRRGRGRGAPSINLSRRAAHSSPVLALRCGGTRVFEL